MYLEGLLVATLAASVSQVSKPVFGLILIFWPIALPILGYKTFRKYQPLIQQLHENPMLRAMLGISSPQPEQQSPLAAILGHSPTISTDEPNPFLTVFTEASPSGEEESNQGDESK